MFLYIKNYEKSKRVFANSFFFSFGLCFELIRVLSALYFGFPVKNEVSENPGNF